MQYRRAARLRKPAIGPSDNSRESVGAFMMRDRFGLRDRADSLNLALQKATAEMLTTSMGKLAGIEKIVGFEYAQLGKDLRMVVLGDYIRKEFMVSAPVNNQLINKMGVIKKKFKLG